MGDSETPNALLTEAYRKFLRSNIKNTKNASTQRYRIRQRVRQGLTDFRLLADEIEDRDLQLIFDADPYTKERYELSKDVAKAIQFMYVGLGGEGNFRGSLKLGVSNGERELGNIESSFHAIPRFAVDRQKQTLPEREIIKAVQSGDFDRLESPDLYAFLRRASDASAIDFDRILDMVDFDDAEVPPTEEQPDVEEWLDTEAENRETIMKALQIGLEELKEQGELPNQD